MSDTNAAPAAAVKVAKKSRKPAAKPAAAPAVTMTALTSVLDKFQATVGTSINAHAAQVSTALQAEKAERQKLEQHVAQLRGAVEALPGRIHATIQENLEQEIMAVASRHAGKILRMGVKQTAVAVACSPLALVSLVASPFRRKPAAAGKAAASEAAPVQA